MVVLIWKFSQCEASRLRRRVSFKCVQLGNRPEGGCPHPCGVVSQVVHTGIIGGFVFLGSNTATLIWTASALRAAVAANEGKVSVGLALQGWQRTIRS